MAVIDMCKMSLVAHSSAKGKILRQLVRLGVIETTRSEVSEETTYRENVERKAELNQKINRLNFVFTFFKERNLYAQKKGITIPAPLDLKRINKLFNLEEFETTSQSEYDVIEKVAEIEEMNNQLLDINSQVVRLSGLREQMMFYASLDIKFSEIKDTENTIMRVGSLPSAKVEDLQEDLDDSVYYQIQEVDNKTAMIELVCSSAIKDDVLSALSKADFTQCPFDKDVLAREEIEKIDSVLEELEQQTQVITEKAIGMFGLVSSFKVLYDYYQISLKKIDVMANSARSASSFMLEGWVPKPDVDKVRLQLETCTPNIFIDFRDPYEDEMPPTYTKNNSIVAPFQGITNMYGIPNPKERDPDPNLFVAIFYFLFFGIMIGDAGYGLIIAFACFGYHYIKKPKKGSGNMILMFGMCGISTLIWGALFGGWFGLEAEVLNNSIFGRLLLSVKWFNPIDEPLIMFGLSLALGILQIAVGFAINAAGKWKKNKLDALLNDMSWVIILLGVAVIAVGTLLSIELAATVGTVFAVLGVVMLLIGGTLNKKGVIQKVFGPLGNLYGGVNVFSDILSYSRLFGLGLATGVIGLVINQLAVIIVSLVGANIAGYLIAFVIVVFGHTFNLGINFLSAYVHNSRLQYIEFFSKFYQGSGKAFMPMGSETKYIFLDN